MQILLAMAFHVNSKSRQARFDAYLQNPSLSPLASCRPFARYSLGQHTCPGYAGHWQLGRTTAAAAATAASSAASCPNAGNIAPHTLLLKSETYAFLHEIEGPASQGLAASPSLLLTSLEIYKTTVPAFTKSQSSHYSTGPRQGPAGRGGASCCISPPPRSQ